LIVAAAINSATYGAAVSAPVAANFYLLFRSDAYRRTPL